MELVWNYGSCLDRDALSGVSSKNAQDFFATSKTLCRIALFCGGSSKFTFAQPCREQVDLQVCTALCEDKQLDVV